MVINVPLWIQDHYKEVTQDEWSNFLTQYECYAIEPDAYKLEHKHSVTRESLAVIVYANPVRLDAPKKYFVRKIVESPKRQ